MDKPPVEVVKAILRFHRYGLVELSQGVVDLVEHHHAIASIGIVLSVVAIKSDSRSKIVHSLLVMSDGHKGLSSFGVVASVGGSFIAVGRRLQTGDGLTKLLNRVLCISFILFFGVFPEELPRLIVQFGSKFLFLYLIPVV